MEELLDELLSGSVSPKAAADFVSMVDDPGQRQALELLLEQRFNNDDYEISPSPARQREIRGLLLQKISAQQAGTPMPAPEQHRRRVMPFRRWAAAAAVLFVLAGTAWFFLSKRTPVLPSQAIRFKSDAAPGGNKATLRLADGSTIQLDGLTNGKLAAQGAALVMKKDSTLTYVTGGIAEGATASGKSAQGATTPDRVVFYNTVSTPAAGQYHLILSDGTQVWLDALSSIRFPSTFAGDRREIEVTGQAYLEVAKASARPFFVKVKEETIQVLGTSFNVNAYDNEPALRTTLREGALKVMAGRQDLLLKPDQQAQLGPGSGLRLSTGVDMNATLAWKDGLFTFNGADIGTIMRQVARWYGVQIVYKDKISEEFVADIPRNVPLSRLLGLLEGTRKVYFTIEGKTVTVMR
jgi:ferric-dicitrate binding protein FerR (iron transport regulator)